MEWLIQEPLPIKPNDTAVAPGNVGPFHIAPRCLEIESWRSRRDGSINIDTDFLRETPLWKPFCTPNHILALVGGEGRRYPFDSGRGWRPRCGRSRSAFSRWW